MTKLKQFREKNGISQAWLAEKMGIHRATLARYESGEIHPPRSFFFQLAHVLRFPVEDVLPLAEDEVHA